MKQILKGSESGWWMLSDGYDVWLPEGMIPYGDANQYGLIGLDALLIGEWQNAPVWLIRSKKREQMSSVRLLLSEDKALFDLVGRAVQLSKFYLSHQFCGYCGQRMVESETEWCCLCNHCRQRYYPQIAPSIIVVVKRENSLLLARHTKHKKPLYTALAGFVEVGETVEQAVHREVFEETHIKIRNLRYIASQPWPFPHSLMMAYLADYDSGEIAIDPHELVDASWYHYNQLPLLPPVGTIARRLVEDTVALCRHQEYSFE